MLVYPAYKSIIIHTNRKQSVQAMEPASVRRYPIVGYTTASMILVGNTSSIYSLDHLYHLCKMYYGRLTQ